MLLLCGYLKRAPTIYVLRIRSTTTAWNTGSQFVSCLLPTNPFSSFMLVHLKTKSLVALGPELLNQCCARLVSQVWSLGAWTGEGCHRGLKQAQYLLTSRLFVLCHVINLNSRRIHLICSQFFSRSLFVKDIIVQFDVTLINAALLCLSGTC